MVAGPYPLETMLRIPARSNGTILSDEAIGRCPSMKSPLHARQFCSPVTDKIFRPSTILTISGFLEQHELGRKIFTVPLITG